LLNHEQIAGIAAVLKASPALMEVEVRNGAGVSLRLRRAPRKATPRLASPSVDAQASVVSESKASSSAVVSERDTSSIAVTAPVVGIFRALGGDAVISPGKIVNEDQVIGQIEAMRLLNDCLAPGSGTVTNVLVEEGQPVEYGQLLFEIAPSEGSTTP
jgi:biotin carboxyl carrier protein